MVAGSIPYVFGTILQPLMVAFDSDSGSISLVGSMNAAMMYISGPVASFLINVYGTRYTVHKPDSL